MPEANHNPDNLRIRCPNCRQRFSVGADLMDRMVECGGCDTRFRINDDVILRSKKFYPGERPLDEVKRFQRVPMPSAAPEGLATMRYAEFHNPEQLESMSPQRIVAGIIGVSFMALVALIFIFAVNPGGSFSIMPLANKLVIAIFSSLLGTALLIYANPNARAKAGFFGLLMGAGIVALPFFFRGQTTANRSGGEFKPGSAEELFPQEEQDPLASLRDRFVTKPLEIEQQKLEQAGNGRHAYGIYLTNLLPRNKYTTRDFLIRETEAEPSSHPFPRDNGDYLMVLANVRADIEEVARIAGRLGETKEIHPEVGVVVVAVDNDLFLAGVPEKLNNKGDPAFYELNKYELSNIDIDRVMRAVERLADAEPAIYRADISSMLLDLLGKPGVKFHDAIARALLVWQQEPELAAGVGLNVLRKTIADGEPAPENLVKLVVRGKSEDAIPVLDALWLQNPTVWEKHYVELGAPIVPNLMIQIGSENAPVRHSAIKLLADVGTDAVLPDLEKLLLDKDSEVRVLAERAIAKIRQR